MNYLPRAVGQPKKVSNMEEFFTGGDQAQPAHVGKMIWQPGCSEMKRIIWMDDTSADTEG